MVLPGSAPGQYHRFAPLSHSFFGQLPRLVRHVGGWTGAIMPPLRAAALFCISSKKLLTTARSCGIIILVLNDRTAKRRASGGIGRLAGFRCQCSQGRAGSTPASRTTKGHPKGCPFCFVRSAERTAPGRGGGQRRIRSPMTCYSNFAVMLPFCRIWPSAFFKKVLFKECAPARSSQSSAYTVNLYRCVFPFGGLGPAYR